MTIQPIDKVNRYTARIILLQLIFSQTSEYILYILSASIQYNTHTFITEVYYSDIVYNI